MNRKGNVGLKEKLGSTKKTVKKTIVKKRNSLDDAIDAKDSVNLSSIIAAFYGESGSGKTTLAGTANVEGKVLLLDFGEQGTASIADCDGVKVIRIKDLAHFNKIFYDLQDDKIYKTIVIDSVQTMQQMAIQSLFIAGFSNHQMDFSSLSFKDLHVGDWGKLNRWTITLITRLNMMCKTNNKNLIYIANVKEEYDSSEDRDKVKDLTLDKNQIPVGKTTVVTDKKDDDDFYLGSGL